MTDVYSVIILDDDYWDGTESWAGEVSEAARDTKYSTRRFTSLLAWEADRDGNAAAADPEIANIFGPWVSHDTGFIVTINYWTNKPAITIQTIGTDARSQDGKYGSNNCYVLENDDVSRCIDINEAGHDITIIGVQFLVTSTSGDFAIYTNNAPTLNIHKCYFKESGDGGCKGVQADAALYITNCIFEDLNRAITGYGTTNIYNCTVTGGDRSILGMGGTATAKNCVAFNSNTSDFYSTETIEACASDDGDDTGTDGIDWDAGATDWAANFTGYATGDFTVKDTDADIYLGSPFSYFDDNLVPTDDIIGSARNTGEGESVCIGAYEYYVAPSGWTGKINGVSSPAKINGIAVADIAKVCGVE